MNRIVFTSAFKCNFVLNHVSLFVPSFLTAANRTDWECRGMSHRQRWFANPFLDYNQERDSTNTTSKENLKRQGLDLLKTALENGYKEVDGGLYVGAVGLTYAYLHVSRLLSQEEKQIFLPLACNAYQAQSMYYQSNPSDRSDACAFLLGKAGFYAVGAVLGKELGDENMLADCISNYAKAGKICIPINFFKHGGDELFVGRAGYLCGALWLQQKLGYIPVERNDLFQIWNSIVESGRQYAIKKKSPCPLMYSYYDTEYLGAAHGLCAILQILMSFSSFLKANKEIEILVKASVDYYISLQDNQGNFPCALDELGSRRRRDEDMLVHWCHGAPGAVYMLAKAYLYFNESKYLESCVKCAEIVWNRGLLKKGPGICHGVAGNGYVFLLIYNLLQQSNEKYLYRANKFAEFLQDPQFLREARRPDCPYSLYEGVAGTACFVLDLLEPNQAEFPFFNVHNDVK